MKALEWSTRNKYNSFNSDKGLTYYEHYKKILSWLDGKGELPPPIEASLDPISACNQNCYYCNSQRYLPAKMVWDKEYIRGTLDWLADWGVKAFCWGGGGEALLNRNIKGMTKYGVSKGMECSIITNGTLMDEYLDELVLCRWVGISIDAPNPALYKLIRGTDDLDKVVDNVARLVRLRNETGGKCDVCLKVLILPENINNLVDCGVLAKSLGVDDLHVRPVDLERKDYGGKREDFNKEKIQDAFRGLHELGDENFHIYTVTHKYDNELHVKHDFNRCLASPLVIQICSDKKFYVCVDHRMEERFCFEKWGSDEHRELIKGINPHLDCSRCTWSEYNKQVEAIESDSMCRDFP